VLTELERLAALVRYLRQAQRRYEQVRTEKALREARALENQVDAFLGALDRGPGLFDPEGRP